MVNLRADQCGIRLCDPSVNATSQLQCDRRFVIAALPAAVLLLPLAAAHEAKAQAAGPVVALPDADRAQLDRLLGKGVVGEALPSAPLAGLDAYLPPKGQIMSYQIVTPDNTPTTETHKIEETTEASFAPGWHYTIENVSGAYLQQESAGRFVFVAETDLDHEVLSRFTPGEPLLVTGLKPGQSIKSSLKVDVYNLSDLKDVAHSGSLDVTYTYVGTYRVTVPAGTYDAALIKWDYNGEVGPANIKDSQYRFLAKGAGMVAMIQIRSISALLVYNDHTKRGKLLERSG